MISNHPSHRILIVFFLTLMFFLLAQTFSFAAKKDKQKDYVMTEVELQSELMSYADRFASIVTQALEDLEALTPASGTSIYTKRLGIFSIVSVYDRGRAESAGGFSGHDLSDNPVAYDL